VEIVTASLVSNLMWPLLRNGTGALRDTGIRASFERSPEGVKARRNRLICRAIASVILTAGSSVILFGWLVFRWPATAVLASVAATVMLTIAAAVLGTVVYGSALAAFTPQATLDVENKLLEEQERLARDTTLPALLRYNREQMALYHQIATSQARAAGRNSQLAMAIGFGALIAGSVVAIASDNATTKLVTGGLAALGGIFSGYIARTFFVAQDKAIGQLYKYWEQPLTTSYLLTAERITAVFADERTRERELAKLIDQLLMVSIRRDAAFLEAVNGRPQPRRRSKSARNGANKPESAPPRPSVP
jgi:hypothetical protein